MTRGSSRSRQSSKKVTDKWWCPLCHAMLKLRADGTVPKHTYMVKGRRFTCPTSKMKAGEAPPTS